MRVNNPVYIYIYTRIYRPQKRPLGRPRRRWEDGIRMWRAVVSSVMNLRVLAPRSYIYIYIYIDTHFEPLFSIFLVTVFAKSVKIHIFYGDN
jgi:hypothetical protein